MAASAGSAAGVAVPDGADATGGGVPADRDGWARVAEGGEFRGSVVSAGSELRAGGGKVAAGVADEALPGAATSCRLCLCAMRGRYCAGLITGGPIRVGGFGRL